MVLRSNVPCWGDNSTPVLLVPLEEHPSSNEPVVVNPSVTPRKRRPIFPPETAPAKRRKVYCPLPDRIFKPSAFIAYKRSCIGDDNYLVCVESNPGPPKGNKGKETDTSTIVRTPLICRHCGIAVTGDIKEHLKQAHPRPVSQTGYKGKRPDPTVEAFSNMHEKAVGDSIAYNEKLRELKAENERIIKEHANTHPDVQRSKRLKDKDAARAYLNSRTNSHLYNADGSLDLVDSKFLNGVEPKGLVTGFDDGGLYQLWYDTLDYSAMIKRVKKEFSAKRERIVIGTVPYQAFFFWWSWLHLLISTVFGPIASVGLWMMFPIGMSGNLYRIVSAMSTFPVFGMRFMGLKVNTLGVFMPELMNSLRAINWDFLDEQFRKTMWWTGLILIWYCLFRTYYRAWQLPYRLRLVAIPIPGGDLCRPDSRPGFDRAERLAPTFYVKHQIAVEVKHPNGYTYYKRWYWTAMPHWWFNRDSRIDNFWVNPFNPEMIRLKKVMINTELLKEALCRKTMMGVLYKPEAAIENMVRLIAANGQYQEDFSELLGKGNSCYRDMCLVCGAIASRSISSPNPYF